MSAAEVLAQHQNLDRGSWFCSCGVELHFDPIAEADYETSYERALALHQSDALKAAGYAVIELPTVLHKGPHDTDVKFFRQVADRMEWPSKRIDYLGGNNVRQAVRSLLCAAADALEGWS